MEVLYGITKLICNLLRKRQIDLLLVNEKIIL